jgi:hypothetical protein
MSDARRCFQLSVVPGPLAMVRLAANAAVPPWAMQGGFFSVTRTDDELSIVCPTDRVPSGVRAETGFRALKVHGPFALSEIGVLAALAAPLAAAKVSVFVISTFETDYLLVNEKQLPTAAAALRSDGHQVADAGGAA